MILYVALNLNFAAETLIHVFINSCLDCCNAKPWTCSMFRTQLSELLPTASPINLQNVTTKSPGLLYLLQNPSPLLQILTHPCSPVLTGSPLHCILDSKILTKSPILHPIHKTGLLGQSLQCCPLSETCSRDLFIKKFGL